MIVAAALDANLEKPRYDSIWIFKASLINISEMGFLNFEPGNLKRNHLMKNSCGSLKTQTMANGEHW